MSREKVGLALLAFAFVGLGAYACSSSSDAGPQPFFNDVPSSSTTAPPAPEDMDANQFPSDAPSYDVDASYSITLCESTCSCNVGSGQYCVGAYTGLSFNQCDIPDAGDGGPPAEFRMGCNRIPEGCIKDAGGGNPCPCIVESLGPLPCLPVCTIDPTTNNATLYCPNP